MNSLLFKGARLLDPESGFDAVGDLLVEGGRIAAVGEDFSEAARGAEVVRADGLCLAPGLVDMRVQLREPGAEHMESIETAGQAAAAGGVTTMVALPNTAPVVATVPIWWPSAYPHGVPLSSFPLTLSLTTWQPQLLVGLWAVNPPAASALTMNSPEVAGATLATVIEPARPLHEQGMRAVGEGLCDGTIDAIASDHAPWGQDSKRQPFSSAAYGIVGLETLLPLSLELYHNGHLGLLEVIRRLTANPARILGLPVGRLAPGAPADLVLFDLDLSWRISTDDLRSKSKNSPFDCRPVRGRVRRTVVDGRTIFWDAG